jgi:hypothetical protein
MAGFRVEGILTNQPQEVKWREKPSMAFSQLSLRQMATASRNAGNLYCSIKFFLEIPLLFAGFLGDRDLLQEAPTRQPVRQHLRLAFVNDGISGFSVSIQRSRVVAALSGFTGTSEKSCAIVVLIKRVTFDTPAISAQTIPAA